MQSTPVSKQQALMDEADRMMAQRHRLQSLLASDRKQGFYHWLSEAAEAYATLNKKLRGKLADFSDLRDGEPFEHYYRHSLQDIIDRSNIEGSYFLAPQKKDSPQKVSERDARALKQLASHEMHNLSPANYNWLGAMFQRLTRQDSDPTVKLSINELTYPSSFTRYATNLKNLLATAATLETGLIDDNVRDRCREAAQTLENKLLPLLKAGGLQQAIDEFSHESAIAARGQNKYYQDLLEAEAKRKHIEQTENTAGSRHKKQLVIAAGVGAAVGGIAGFGASEAGHWVRGIDSQGASAHTRPAEENPLPPVRIDSHQTPDTKKMEVSLKPGFGLDGSTEWPEHNPMVPWNPTLDSPFTTPRQEERPPEGEGWIRKIQQDEEPLAHTQKSPAIRRA